MNVIMISRCGPWMVLDLSGSGITKKGWQKDTRVSSFRVVWSKPVHYTHHTNDHRDNNQNHIPIPILLSSGGLLMVHTDMLLMWSVKHAERIWSINRELTLSADYQGILPFDEIHLSTYCHRREDTLHYTTRKRPSSVRYNTRVSC